MKELISIIIPVYNVEKYLEKCIQSITQQTYTNLEIILIDDGSSDSSGRICDEFAKNDSRIKVIHKTNEGVSKARNVGIDNATGQYIVFVDSDDYVAKNYISVLYEDLIENNADISICGTCDCFNGEIVRYSIPYIQKVNSQEALRLLLDEKIFFCVVWAKLYKKELFEKYRFNEKTVIAEDLEIIYKIISDANYVFINTNEKMYYYQIRKDSATTEEFNSDWEKEIDISAQIIEFIEKKYPNILNYAIKRYIRVNQTLLRKLILNNTSKAKEKELLNNIKSIRRKYNYKVNLKSRLAIFFMSNSITKFALKIYFKIKRRGRKWEK